MPLSNDLKIEIIQRQQARANVCLERGQYREAEVIYQELAETFPNVPEFWLGLGNAKLARKEDAQAEECFRDALDIQEDNWKLHQNLGVALANQGRWQDAIRHMTRALALNPDCSEAHLNLGMLYYSTDHQPQRAIAAYENCLKSEPNNADAHFGLGIALLRSGQFQRGWEEYEWRFKKTRLTPFYFTPPQGTPWRGENVCGKTVLLVGEQGAGDTIQFIRYAPLLKEWGAARIILQCYEYLESLLNRCEGVDAVYPYGANVGHYDCYSYLLSLPQIFRTRLENVPDQVPYLSADPGWCQEMRPGFNVGVCYRGNRNHENVRYRDISPDLFTELAARKAVDITLVSLQYGFPPPDGIADWGRRINNFAELASAIANLDLVITCDTAVGHLAGAMNKPCWILLPFNSDWRWLTDRDDSPWYPSVRLFRQKRLGDWDEVFERVCEALPCSTMVPSLIG